MTSAIFLTIFLVACLTASSLSLDTKFTACEQKSCFAGPNISFPFYINGIQSDYCGLPGFNVNCDDMGHVIYKGFQFNTYRVTEIDYVKHHFQVIDVDFLNLMETCNPPNRNLTLLDLLFNFIPDQNYRFYIYTCPPNSSISATLAPYALSCSTKNGVRANFVTMIDDGGNITSKAAEECGPGVWTTVEIDNRYETEIVGKWALYKEVLQRGFWLKWTATNCTGCTESGGRCGFDEEDYRFLCYCRKRPYDDYCHSGSSWKVIVSVGCSVSGSGIAIVVILLLMRQKRRQDPQNIIKFLQDSEFLAPKRYKYSEIKRMTCSFKYKLGQGGFGIVYKGVLEDGRLVAVKVLNMAKSSGGEDFMNEVASISKTSHVNVVSLMGFCISRTKRALVYEFVANGSLEKFIYEGKSSEPNRLLDWDKLYNISIGIAQGLGYLHRGCNTRILHFDIKPHNILLDEDFCTKISDFGLAKVCKHMESGVSMFGARGTVGYIAPEQVCRNFGPVSHKCDVYSYGMMILEMVGGRKNVESGVENASEVYFPHWIYSRIRSGQELGLNGIIDEDDSINARKMVLVGLWCIQTDPANRPPMSQVVNMLQGSIAALSIPPNPYLYSHPDTHQLSSISSPSFGTRVTKSLHLQTRQLFIKK